MQRTILHRLVVVMVTTLGLCSIAVGSAAGDPPVAGKAARHSARHAGKRAAPQGVVFGGVTSQGLPVAIQVSRDGREVVQMAMAMPLTCQPSGASIIVPAAYKHVPISASGAFQDSFEGSDSEGMAKGALTGRFNRSMTAISTTWTLTLTVHSQTVSDTCASGSVSFTAIQ